MERTFSREEIVAANPIIPYMEKRGAQFKRIGREMATLCPLHEDSSPSFRVNEEKQTWFCDPCGKGGSIIDLVMVLEGLPTGQAIASLSASAPPAPFKRNGNGHTAGNGAKGKIVATYSYTNERGEEIYQSVRYDPKDFRQRHKKGDQWVWSMEGVRRVLYNLPAVLSSPIVFVVEGEKDADTMIKAGLPATCNVGGAGKWLEGYSESLAGKDVVIIPDNDEPGKKHAAKVQEALAGKVKTTSTVFVPGDFKDISDWIASFPTPKEGFLEFAKRCEKAPRLTKGVEVPLLGIEELEDRYKQFVNRSAERSLSLGEWLPSFRYCVRPLLPGDMALILGGTGVGKTMILQNLACAITLPTCFFEIELCDALTFERFASMRQKAKGEDVFRSYLGNPGMTMGNLRLAHVQVCVLSKLAPEDIERIIIQYELKTGTKPAVVMIDYVGLVRGRGGSRYERMSDVAEQLRIIAKATDTILVIASQVARKEGNEIFLTDAKDSGSLENSSSLVLGVWRDANDESLLTMKVLKNTKGAPGRSINCKVEGETLTIRELDLRETINK